MASCFIQRIEARGIVFLDRGRLARCGRMPRSQLKAAHHDSRCDRAVAGWDSCGWGSVLEHPLDFTDPDGDARKFGGVWVKFDAQHIGG